MICDQCETVAHCMKHGCIPKQQALDKMAENARELGLDHEPAQTDWEAVAADQAMTIALLKADQPAQQEPYESPYNPNPVEYQYHYPDGSWKCSNGEVVNGMHPDLARSLYALKDNT